MRAMMSKGQVAKASQGKHGICDPVLLAAALNVAVGRDGAAIGARGSSYGGRYLGLMP